MKKSSAVPATFCAAVAALILQGCSSPVSVRRCVDPTNGTILPDTACTNPIIATTYRGGRYARVPSSTGNVCIDTNSNQVVPDSYCRNTTSYYPGYYHAGRLIRSPRWGYDGSVSSGRVTNFTSTPRAGSDIHSSSGGFVSHSSTSTSRGGFGSTGRGFSGFS
ncbi:MAG: hypothetical protein JST12_15825 [Armatimonadetes bacterium]|nr:hypothetical protein [Armatimonadota bacterium]